MDYATKFCLITCVTSVFCSVSEGLYIRDNSTSEPTKIDCDDFCRLRYYVNDTELVLKPGEYTIRKDGTLSIDLNNSTLNKTLFEVWSNDSAPNATDCKIRYEIWQFELAGHLVSLIALQMCLGFIVMTSDSVRLVEITSTLVVFLLCFCFSSFFIRLPDCPQNHFAIYGLIHYISLTWVFWKSSGVFDSFMNQVTYYPAGGIHIDNRLTQKNVIINFTSRMLGMAIFSSVFHVLGIPFIEPITEEAVECGVPHRRMYLTLTRSVTAYLIIGVINFVSYRKFLSGIELAAESLWILKDLCDLNFMFFVILALTWIIGCLFSAAFYVYCGSILELCIFLMLLCNFLRYCYSINWRGGFLFRQ